MRGDRKCETCRWFQDRRDQWAAGCNLDNCECRAQAKEFGIALCPNYKSQTFIDTSGLRLSGPVAGSCHWEPPPLLRPWPCRPPLVALTDWCSLHERQGDLRGIHETLALPTGAAFALTSHKRGEP